MDKNLSNKVLETIKEDGLRPKSKVQFLLKNWVMWVLGAGAVIVGGFAFAMVIHVYVLNDGEFYTYFGDDKAFVVIPYLWLLLFLLFIIIADLQIRYTDKGYRYSLFKIGALVIALSFVIGIAAWGLGVGTWLDQELGQRSELYRRAGNPHIGRWYHPEEGMLLGEVLAVDAESLMFDVRDPEGAVWHVILNDDVWDDSWADLVGLRLRMIGQQTGEYLFEALVIRPMNPWEIDRAPIHDDAYLRERVRRFREEQPPSPDGHFRPLTKPLP